MTDITPEYANGMVEELRGGIYSDSTTLFAADLIEAQAARIAELEAALPVSDGHKKFTEIILGLFVEGVSEIDMFDVQEWGVKTGVLRQVVFDPEQHIDVTGASEVGDPYFEIVEAASAWQPIETAPKDGSEFLCWHIDCYIVGYWNGEKIIFDGGLNFEPAHWQPLPTPPTTKG